MLPQRGDAGIRLRSARAAPAMTTACGSSLAAGELEQQGIRGAPQPLARHRSRSLLGGEQARSASRHAEHTFVAA